MPTSAEWEYLAFEGKPFDEKIYKDWGQSSFIPYPGELTPADWDPVNSLGVHNMRKSVAEWCWDIEFVDEKLVVPANSPVIIRGRRTESEDSIKPLERRYGLDYDVWVNFRIVRQIPKGSPDL